MKQFITLLFSTMFVLNIKAQNIIGQVYDFDTKEPISATIKFNNKVLNANSNGTFELPNNIAQFEISSSGYISQIIKTSSANFKIALVKSTNNLQEIVVTANRDAINRTQTPISIASISAKTIKETKATTIDQLVNKVSGVYMVNLGNEQHSMSIRQPLGTRSLFLYLEDGIPIRTSGVFNHNALMEMNMAAVRNIEVIKGPSSSLYGGEAIGGVVNMITQSPTVIPTFKISAQLNDIGYKRADLQTGFIKGKWGFNFSGYYANRKNGFVEFSDFNKTIFTSRVDYTFNNKTKLENSFTYMDYYSDMSGSVDSSMFANKAFTSQQTFTYRKATTIRYRSTLIQEWNAKSKTTLNAVFRSNSLGQNPSYRVRDDYRRVGSTFIGNKTLAHGEINDNSFKSYVLIAQHRQKMNWLNSTLVGGATFDYSPNTSIANYIRINKDTLIKKYTSYIDRPDSLLVNYQTNISNFASFINFEFSPLEKLHIVASIRYDVFKYKFDNFLPTSSVSGSSDTTSSFSKISNKIGFTYNFSKNKGIYANYSEGFVPPQVSELYRAVKVPTLEPSTFINYEVGGWFAIIKNKLTVDFSLYQLEGKNSIISVRFDDGTYGNANAGATLHKGVEIGILATPINNLQIRLNGSYSKHTFKTYVEKGVSFSGNEMNNAPRWIHNAEIMYRPSFIKNFRIAVEWQKMSEYYMDQTNTYKYEGFNVVNLRTGYSIKNAEIWLNVINVLDAYYALNSSSSSYGKTYTVAEPRNFNIGISYDLGKLFTK